MCSQVVGYQCDPCPALFVEKPLDEDKIELEEAKCPFCGHDLKIILGFEDKSLGPCNLGVCTNEDCKICGLQIIYGHPKLKQVNPANSYSRCPICMRRTLRRATKSIPLP